MLTRIRTMLYTGMYTGKKDTGASAVEYGLLVAGIALVVIAAVFFLGGAVSSSFNEVGSSVSNAG
jgi:pilus assembly protein Flp/PilA